MKLLEDVIQAAREALKRASPWSGYSGPVACSTRYLTPLTPDAVARAQTNSTASRWFREARETYSN